MEKKFSLREAKRKNRGGRWKVPAIIKKMKSGRPTR